MNKTLAYLEFKLMNAKLNSFLTKFKVSFKLKIIACFKNLSKEFCRFQIILLQQKNFRKFKTAYNKNDQKFKFIQKCIYYYFHY